MTERLEGEEFRRRLVEALEALEGTDEARVIRAAALVARVMLGARADEN